MDQFQLHLTGLSVEPLHHARRPAQAMQTKRQGKGGQEIRRRCDRPPIQCDQFDVPTVLQDGFTKTFDRIGWPARLLGDCRDDMDYGFFINQLVTPEGAGKPVLCFDDSILWVLPFRLFLLPQS